MDDIKHKKILIEIARYTGKQVSASFIKRTKSYIPRIDRFHTLITGIYKPSWSDYALSIITKIKSPYDNKDEVIFLEDGRWIMDYAPRSGGPEHPDNRALVKCLKDKVPLGVFKQITDKKSRSGSTYRVLGLGLISNYDSKRDVFIIESAPAEILEEVTSIIPDEELRYEIELYAGITNEFRPFVREEKALYRVNSQKRDEAFRQVILKEYDFTCTVCDMKVRLDNLYEVNAAHIVPKADMGTDDPRNGISLCRTHHWAFDSGLFSISDNYRVLLSPALKKADTRNFELINMGNKEIILPENKVFSPHHKALSWHRDRILLR